MTAKLAFFALLVVALSACGSDSHAVYKTQPVGMHDIELEVPAAWKLGQGQSCGTPTANTVLWNNGAQLLCHQMQPPNVSAVIFQAYPPQADPKYAGTKTIGGVRVWRSTRSQGRYVQLDLPGRGIGVTVFSPDARLVRQIVSSLHTARRDKNGCPTHTTGGYRLGSRPKADERFIPPGAIKLIGCYYNGRWLDHSVRVGRDRAQQVTRVMNNAHYGLSGMPRGRIAGRWCRPSFGKFSVGHFEYANRPPVAVTVHPNGCLGASNGTWAVRMSHAWVPTFWRNDTYDGSDANGWDS